MEIKDIKQWLSDNGWEEDRFGHMVRMRQGLKAQKKYRVKFQARSIRYEVQATMDTGEKFWVRLASGYFKDVLVIPEGKYNGRLKIGTVGLLPANAASAAQAS